MSEQAYLTVKIFTFTISTIIVIFLSVMSIIVSSLSVKMAANDEGIAANNKLIYEHQLKIVQTLGDIKTSIEALKK